LRVIQGPAVDFKEEIRDSMQAMSETIVNILKTVSLTPTDGVMIVVGTVLIFLLHRFLANSVFSPLLEHVEQREALTTGALHTASQMRQKAEALKGRFDEAIFRARVEGNSKRAEIVSNAKDQASRIIRAAESEAANEVQVGRDAIARQIAQANTSAEATVQDLAKQLAGRVDSQLSSH
jgi:F0F1-type ATP synthase membrane subunit b/b'